MPRGGGRRCGRAGPTYGPGCVLPGLPAAGVLVHLEEPVPLVELVPCGEGEQVSAITPHQKPPAPPRPAPSPPREQLSKLRSPQKTSKATTSPRCSCASRNCCSQRSPSVSCASRMAASPARGGGGGTHTHTHTRRHRAAPAAPAPRFSSGGLKRGPPHRLPPHLRVPAGGCSRGSPRSSAPAPSPAAPGGTRDPQRGNPAGAGSTLPAATRLGERKGGGPQLTWTASSPLAARASSRAPLGKPWYRTASRG